MTRIIVAFALLLTLLSGCTTAPYYQKSYSMPGNQWNMAYKPSFVIDIEDTNMLYNVSFIIRHTNNFPYSNIWMNVLVKAPGEATFKKTRIEIPLATPQGTWLGVGMGEIYEQRRVMMLDHKDAQRVADSFDRHIMSVSEQSINDLFSKKGRYEIRLEQNMREQSLPDILHIGLRIEKGSAKKEITPATKPLS